jgi:hypothetical protein
MTIEMKSIKTLSDRAMYLVLDWSFLGIWKQAVTNDTSNDVRASKRIVKSEAVSDMRKLNYKVRAMLAKYSLNSLFRPGVYVVPTENVETVDVFIQEAIVDMVSIREKLFGEWDDVIADAKERLGDLFDVNDYPSADKASAEFDMTYRYTSIATTPSMLQHIAADIYEQDLERTRKETEKELESFRSSLRVTLLEIVDNMRRTLSKPDGEKRVFGQRFFKRLDEFMEGFDTKNLSDDGELAAIVKQLKSVANGTDVTTLKSDETLQGHLNEQLEDITHAMASMIQDDGRIINFDAV